MSLLRKSDGILDLLKAEGGPKPPASPTPAASPASPGGGGGGGAAPMGAEARKRGGKYIRRWWSGDHWEYEYAGEPSADSHGIGNAFKEDHTMDVPDGLSPDVASVADRADAKIKAGQELSGAERAAMEQVYEHSRENGAHTEKGYKQIVTDPITGLKMEVKFARIKKHASGALQQSVEITSLSDESGNFLKESKAKRETRLVTYGIKKQSVGSRAQGQEDLRNGGWKSFLAHMRSRAEVQKAKEAGIITDTRLNNSSGAEVGEINLVEHTQGAAGADYPWKISINKNSNLGGEYYGDTLHRKDAKAANAMARYLEAVSDRIDAPSVPASQSLAEGKSASLIIQEGNLPFGQISGDKKDVYRFGNLVSPEERDALKRSLMQEFAVEMMGEEKVQDDTHLSFMETALDNAIQYYTPINPKKGGRSLKQFIKKEYGMRVAFSNKYSKTTSLTGEDGGQMDHASNMVETVEKFEEVGDEAMQGADIPSKQLADYKDQMLSRYEQLKTNPKYAEITEHFTTILNRLDPSSADDSSNAPAEEVRSKIAPLSDFAQAVASHTKTDPQQILEMFVMPEKLGKSIHDACTILKAIVMVKYEQDLEKANFQYSHKEGSDMYPKYVYKDEAGNYANRVNAPQGHQDYDSAYGDPDEDDFGPETAPQFFTMDGRKLSRAPYTGADVQWNPNYHRADPQNLWAARWVNPVTGEHEYTYIDADIRENPMLAIHRQNSLTDVRLPYYRQYVAALFKSEHQKDKVVAVILALLDQGRFRVRELMALKVGDVRLSREMLQIGRRKVHADINLMQQLSTMTSNRHPEEPLFCVAPVDMQGGMDHAKMRRLGPHFVVNLLEELGISAEALQMYHASQTYSMEVQRIFGAHNVSYDAAHNFALLEVASEMGHNLDNVEDFEAAIHVIESAAIDPIVIQAIKTNCQSMGIGAGGETMLRRPVFDSVPHVSMILNGRTEDEEEFSKWLRMVPVHNYLQQEATNEVTPDQMQL